jgi:RHS repeat-associated protein
VNGQATTYVYDATGQLAVEYGSATDAGTNYLTADHLGSTRLITDATGSVARCYDYLPFGEEIANGTAGRTDPCFGSGTYPAPQDIESAKFTGKQRDAETGLDWFDTRYFSAAQGRYTSPDGMIAKKEWLSDPQRWNHYAYVRNNPMRYIDPNGEDLEIYYYYGKDLTDEQRKYLQANMKQIQAAITAKFNKAGVEKVVFRDGTGLTDAQIKEIQKNAPTGVATLNFVNEKFAGESIRGNGTTDAPISAVSLKGVAEGGLIASRAKDDATLTFRLGEVASHELGHAVGFEYNSYINWPLTLGIADYFRSNLMDEHQGQPTRPKFFDTGSDRNKRIIQEINRIGDNTPKVP